MQRSLPFYVLFLMGILWVCSCKQNNPDFSDTKIIGIWQLQKQFSKEGKDDSFQEFPLSTCEKKTTLEVTLDGTFIEKSYYEDFGTGGECLKDTEETMGNWKKKTNEDFDFMYSQNSVFRFKKSRAMIKNNHLVVIITYDDPDLGYETTLQFLYLKKNINTNS